MSDFKVKNVFCMEIIGIGVIKETGHFNWALVFPGELLEF